MNCGKKYFDENQEKTNKILFRKSRSITKVYENYNKQNREKISIHEEKRKNDFNFKLSHNIRVRTRQSFEAQDV